MIVFIFILGDDKTYFCGYSITINLLKISVLSKVIDFNKKMKNIFHFVNG